MFRLRHNLQRCTEADRKENEAPMAVTMNDVARAAGVSLKTVSNVLNDYEFIRPATKQRVQDAIAELGYEANLTARSLRSGKTRMLGLVLSDLSAPYYAELASRLMKVAARRGYRVLVEQSGAAAENELNALQGAFRQLTDGLLFTPLALDGDAVASHRGKKPVVLLGEHVLDPRLDLVTMKNEEAAQAVTAHLLTLGRRRIAVVGAGPEDSAGGAGLRLKGYRKALEAAGVDFDPDLVAAVEWRRQGPSGCRRCRLRRHRRGAVRVAVAHHRLAGHGRDCRAVNCLADRPDRRAGSGG
jgi:DNA-binding LacI/PurR family transcriptional regulator